MVRWATIMLTAPEGFVKMSSMKLLGLMAVLFLIAAPAGADTVTLNFSGTVNLSSVGGAASNTFSGSFTWDPSTVPFNYVSLPGEDTAYYLPNAYSFTLNSTNISASTFDAVIVVDYHPGVIADFFVTFDAFDVYLGSVGATSNYLESFGADILTPPGVFGGTSLPGNLNFLGSASSTDSAWYTGTGVDIGDSANVENPKIAGTFTPTIPSVPTPEPSSVILTLVGIALLLAIRKHIDRGFPLASRSFALRF
jgi:hypothetical protein